MSQKERSHFNEIFEQELLNLNEGQQQAVHQIEGPILVIAGPGTGKTHILSARIGKILSETDTLPHNILCLTFTDAGVLAMRERLLEFIGPDAHKVHIFTFHSFCNMVIQDNMEVFGYYDLELVTDLERVEIIREIIDEQDDNHILKKGRNDAYYYEKHLKNLFKMMKSEKWTADFVHNRIDNYLEDLPQRDEFIYKRKSGQFQKGDIKKHEIEKEKAKTTLLKAAADLFPIYLSKMEKRGRYEFEDMILWVLEKFNEDENLLRTYQEQYLYFLVDEYQDTNGAQNEILQQLINYWEKPNIFVVGDDDQSIFEFQGARLRNIMDFYYSHKPHIRLVMLKDNYRSSQNILDASKAVIDINQERVISNIEGLDKTLIARNREFAKSVILPKVIAYPNRMHEDVAIANHIERLYKEGFPLNEVAVIYAKHKQAQNVIKLLEKKKIPYNTKRRVNILDLTYIRNLLELLKYVHLESKKPYSGEELLFSILHFDFFEIPASDLSRLSIYLAKSGKSRELTWRDVIADRDELKKIKFSKPDKVLRFSELVDELIIAVNNLSCLAFLERLINRSGLLSHTLNHEDNAWRLQVLHTFFDFVRKQTDKTPRLSIKRLLDILGYMDANKLQIGINKTISAENGVNLLTAHGSKGLEFQVVMMIDGNKDWEPGRKGHYTFSLPDTLTHSGAEDGVESRRRLFYVAMTRAKEQLFISYAANDNSGKPQERCKFIDELVSSGLDIHPETRVVPERELIAAQALMLTELEKPRMDIVDKAAVAELLQGFTLSVSAMNSYQRCPISFYYENVLRLPSLASPAATYGTSMHHALKRLFDKMLAHPEKEFPPQEEFVRDFEFEMKRHRHYFPKGDYLRRLKMGREFLGRFYDENVDKWEKDVLPELGVYNVEHKGVPLKGSIDLVVLRGKDKVKIIDYKTGRLDGNRLKKPSNKNVKLKNGGIYWRQLFFYKILYENHDAHTRIADTGEIVYLSYDKKDDFVTKSLTFDKKGVAQVGEMIVETYEDIKALRFEEGCGDPKCKWCAFVKRNIMPESFRDEEAEDLDD